MAGYRTTKSANATLAGYHRGNALVEYELAVANLERRRANMARWRALAEKCYRAGPYPGAVYFIEAVGSGTVKIGWIANPGGAEQRLRELQVGCPYTLALWGTIEGCTEKDERRIHKHFKPVRLRGEWFKMEGELLDMLNVLGANPVAGANFLRESMKKT